MWCEETERCRCRQKGAWTRVKPDAVKWKTCHASRFEYCRKWKFKFEFAKFAKDQAYVQKELLVRGEGFVNFTERSVENFIWKLNEHFRVSRNKWKPKDKEWKTNISRRPSHYRNHRLEGILGTNQKTPAMAFPLGWTPPHDSDRTRSESADSESRPTTLEAIIRRRSSNMKGWTVL